MGANFSPFSVLLLIMSENFNFGQRSHSLGDRWSIRRASDTLAPPDSEPARILQSDSDNDQLPIADRLQQNRLFMDRFVSPPLTNDWILETQSTVSSEGDNVVLIRKPTASYLGHRFLNPYAYSMIQDVGSLTDIAALLKAPEDWVEIYNRITADRILLTQLEGFRELPDETLEMDIQGEFISLVAATATRLGVIHRSRMETNTVVGGILALHRYDFRSASDPSFVRAEDNVELIASEVKTHLTLGYHQKWYQKSRGIQLLAALYSFNCPTFLLTQKQWKVFMENEERNAVLTFPFGNNPEQPGHVNSCSFAPMGSDFLRASMISLRSQRMPVLSPQGPPKNKQPSASTNTAPKRDRDPRLYSSPAMPSKRARVTHVSNAQNGQPVYSTVRIWSQEAADEMVENA